MPGADRGADDDQRRAAALVLDPGAARRGEQGARRRPALALAWERRGPDAARGAVGLADEDFGAPVGVAVSNGDADGFDLGLVPGGERAVGFALAIDPPGTHGFDDDEPAGLHGPLPYE